MNKQLVGAMSVAAAGGGLIMGCTQPPAPAPVPALGCYSDGGVNADAKIVGLVGQPGALEAYDPGSDCTTNDSVGPLSITFVEAADATEAEAACTALDAENDFWLDLAAWDTPAPGLAGYWSCSDKNF